MSGRERIRGEGLCYTYLTRIETLALKDLDLTIRDGEFCSIVGRAAAGNPPCWASFPVCCSRRKDRSCSMV